MDFHAFWYLLNREWKNIAMTTIVIENEYDFRTRDVGKVYVCARLRMKFMRLSLKCFMLDWIYRFLSIRINCTFLIHWWIWINSIKLCCDEQIFSSYIRNICCSHHWIERLNCSLVVNSQKNYYFKYEFTTIHSFFLFIKIQYPKLQ